MDSVKSQLANIINAQSNSLNKECQDQIPTEKRLSLKDEVVNEDREAHIKNRINQEITTNNQS